jgi:23S rRNA pseudouridine2605 synthase/23S rRNA pseudouridine2604 synthase
MIQIRLQKFLSEAGVCSRRKGEEYIKAGRVAVNGQIVRTLGTKVTPGVDRVEFDGRTVVQAADSIYIALNKPEGYVTSCSHPGEKVVVDLLDTEQRVVPVGRLDKDSTGLLLLTNDGRLHHRLSHPSFDHEKEYEVTLAEPINDGALEKLAQGVVLNGRRTRPAEVVRVSGRRFRMTLKEGRNRQIRRMAAKVGSRVERLKRIRIANVRLGRLKKGQWRYLTQKEKNRLLISVLKDPPPRR